jgi:hypothetical protein
MKIEIELSHPQLELLLGVLDAHREECSETLHKNSDNLDPVEANNLKEDIEFANALIKQLAPHWE